MGLCAGTPTFRPTDASHSSASGIVDCAQRPLVRRLARLGPRLPALRASRPGPTPSSLRRALGIENQSFSPFLELPPVGCRCDAPPRIRRVTQPTVIATRAVRPGHHRMSCVARQAAHGGVSAARMGGAGRRSPARGSLPHARVRMRIERALVRAGFGGRFARNTRTLQFVVMPRVLQRRTAPGISTGRVERHRQPLPVVLNCRPGDTLANGRRSDPRRSTGTENFGLASG